MDKSDGKIVLYAPVHLNDIGLGGGENYTIGDNQGNWGTLCMARNPGYKIHLIYKDTEICRPLYFISVESIYIHINDEKFLNMGCKIIIKIE